MCRTACRPEKRTDLDLIRELETGREEVSRYIPKYLGRMMCQLPEYEFRESMQVLEELVRSDNPSRALRADDADGGADSPQ